MLLSKLAINRLVTALDQMSKSLHRLRFTRAYLFSHDSKIPIQIIIVLRLIHIAKCFDYYLVFALRTLLTKTILLFLWMNPETFIKILLFFFPVINELIMDPLIISKVDISKNLQTGHNKIFKKNFILSYLFDFEVFLSLSKVLKKSFGLGVLVVHFGFLYILDY